jgi:hypothetical protein
VPEGSTPLIPKLATGHDPVLLTSVIHTAVLGKISLVILDHYIITIAISRRQMQAENRRQRLAGKPIIKAFTT